MKRVAVLFGSVVVGLCGSCERHSWEETRALHVGHAAHGSSHHSGAENSAGKSKEQTQDPARETRFFR